jgi:hypothetical protein
MTDSIKKFLSAVKNRRTQKGDAIFNRVFSFFPLSSSHYSQKIGWGLAMTQKKGHHLLKSTAPHKPKIT